MTTLARRLVRLEHLRRPASEMPTVVVAIDDDLAPGAVVEVQAGPAVRVVRVNPETPEEKIVG
jgi:hypothetical protein